VLGLALVLSRLLVSPPINSSTTVLNSNPSDSPPRESSVFSFDIVSAPLPNPPALTRPASPVLPLRPRRGRRGKASVQAPSRQSARIAAKNKGNFVAVQDQAENRKALLNSLSGCSSTLKKHVHKKNILSRNKIPFSVSDIRKLLSAASVGCSNASSVGVSTEVAA
jgi:hypothetical protein